MKIVLLFIVYFVVILIWITCMKYLFKAWMTEVIEEMFDEEPTEFEKRKMIRDSVIDALVEYDRSKPKVVKYYAGEEIKAGQAVQLSGEPGEDGKVFIAR